MITFVIHNKKKVLGKYLGAGRMKQGGNLWILHNAALGRNLKFWLLCFWEALIHTE
jgi:hypothetical protein